MLRRAMMAGGGAGSPIYIGGSFAVNQTSDTPSLAVPAGAQAGDTVIAILRCRGDRSMSGFSGWASHQDQMVPSTVPEDAGHTRIYILSRTLAAETSFSFTHSANAAYGAALLVFRNGTVGANALPDSVTAGITKASNDSILLAVSLANGSYDDPTATPPKFSGYTQRGISSFFASPTYFYVTICETRAGVAAGSVSATSSFTSGSQYAAWLAEIG